VRHRDSLLGLRHRVALVQSAAWSRIPRQAWCQGLEKGWSSFVFWSDAVFQLPTLPPAPRPEVGRGRGRGRTASNMTRSPVHSVDMDSGGGGGDLPAPDEQAPDADPALGGSRSPAGTRSPPQVRVWARTATMQDRPVSVATERPADDLKTSPRGSAQLAATRHKSAATRMAPAPTAPGRYSPSGAPDTPPLMRASAGTGSGSGTSSGTGSPAVAPRAHPNQAPGPSMIPSPRVLPEEGEGSGGEERPGSSNNLQISLSARTLQRLSKRISQHDLRKRNDTMRSLDTRIKEALLAGTGEGASSDGNGASGAGDEAEAVQETNDQVWAWGNRGLDVISHPTPQVLPELGSKNVKQVCAGYQHMIMVLENGAVYTWGVGKEGRLGHGKNDADQLLPLRVEALAALNIKLVAAGGSCSLALTHDGVCYFWGWLGVEEAMRFVSPVVVEGLEKQRIVSVACGENHVLALSMDHQVFSWGLNKNGSLGQGRKELEFAALPKVVMPNQEVIACGPYSGACISTKGQLSYWGPNLTKKKEKPFKKPEKITHKGHLVGVALGAQHMLMMEDNGDIYALGEGADGQLGTGYYTAQAEPVKVEFPLSREEKLRLRGITKAPDGSATAAGGTGLVRPNVPSGGSSTKPPPTAKPRAFGRGVGAAAPPASTTMRDGASGPAPKQIKAIGAGNASSVAVTKEGMVFVWGKIDSKASESFLQPTLVRVLDKIAIDQVSVNADQIVALVGLKNERDIRYFSFNPPIVKAATLGKLVDWLVSDKSQHDPLFLYAFFVSHDVFSSSMDVLDELMARYERARATEGAKLQTRLLAVLMQWIKMRPADFRQPAAKKRMEEFLTKMEPAPQRQIRKCIETEESALQQQPVSIPPPSSKQSLSSLLGRSGAVEVAQQMALLDKMFFDRIRPTPELTHQNWMKSAKRDLSPNVLAFIARFNQLFYVIVTDCLAQEQTAARSARFNFWAEFHQQSVAIGNLSAAVCVASALNSVPIRKLAKRDLIVLKPQQRQSLEDFRKLLSDRNKAGYRELLQRRIDDGEPAVPYLATMLSDLTFVEEGNKSTLADGLIHFYKFHLIGKQLQTVDELQKRSYNSFAPDETLQALLANAQGLDEELCDKVADAICAGEPIGQLLASLEAKRDRSGSGAVPTEDKVNEGKLDALAEALDKEAQSLRDMSNPNKRLEVWNAWLSRVEKEGDEFRAMLCSSSALSESVDSVLLEAIRKPESAVFSSLLSKLLSPPSNARPLMALLTSLTPVTSVFSDLREEVVRLCVAQEFNALVEALGNNTLKGAPVGFFELAEEEERRAKARAAADLLDAIDFDQLDQMQSCAAENVVNLLGLPAVKGICDYATGSLEDVLATREAQLDERIATLQQSALDAAEGLGGSSGGGDGSAESEHLALVKEKLSDLQERERELEEALALVREEIMQTRCLLEEAEAAVTSRGRASSGGQDAEATAELLAKEEKMRELMTSASGALRLYLDKVHGPRQAKLLVRLERLKQMAVAKGAEFLKLFGQLRDSLQLCVVDDDGFDAMECKRKEASREQLKEMLGRAREAFAPLDSVFRSTELDPDLLAQLDAVLEECDQLL
jgi:alpha-tubulin suppressor-like RCC1 family protein